MSSQTQVLLDSHVIELTVVPASTHGSAHNRGLASLVACDIMGSTGFYRIPKTKKEKTRLWGFIWTGSSVKIHYIQWSKGH